MTGNENLMKNMIIERKFKAWTNGHVCFSNTIKEELVRVPYVVDSARVQVIW